MPGVGLELQAAGSKDRLVISSTKSTVTSTALQHADRPVAADPLRLEKQAAACARGPSF